jgi:hypothetical protein
MELAVHPQTRLVCMGDGRGAEGLTDGRDRGFEPLAGPLYGRQDGGVGQREVEEGTHQVSRALRRQHVVLGQVHRGPFQARPILHRRLHAFGKLAPVPLAAGAAGL